MQYLKLSRGYIANAVPKRREIDRELLPCGLDELLVELGRRPRISSTA